MEGKGMDAVVANEAVRCLNAFNIDTKKRRCAALLQRPLLLLHSRDLIHFDDPDSGESGPSVGYPLHHENESAVAEWKAFIPNSAFQRRVRPDDFTKDEEEYYGFRFTSTDDAEFLVELGDIGSEHQGPWMAPGFCGSANCSPVTSAGASDSRSPHPRNTSGRIQTRRKQAGQRRRAV